MTQLGPQRAGDASLLALDLADHHPAQLKLADIVAAGERASELVSRILVFGREQSPQRRAVRVQDVVREVMRFMALRSLSGVKGGEDSAAGGGAASIFKLAWADWHKRLGEAAMDVLGPAGLLADGAPYDLNEWQRLFLFSRADSIYGGSDEVQRNILAERVLGLPREPKGTA